MKSKHDNVTQCYRRGSGDVFPLPVPSETNGVKIGFRCGFIISSGTIRWAGWREVSVNLSLSVSSGAEDGRERSLSCSLTAVWEDRGLKIPDKNKNDQTSPTAEERAQDTDTEEKKKKTDFCSFVGFGQVGRLSLQRGAKYYLAVLNY